MTFIQQIDRSIETQLDLLAKIQQEITDLSLLKQEATDLISIAQRVAAKKASLGGAIATLKLDLLALFDENDDGGDSDNSPRPSPAPDDDALEEEQDPNLDTNINDVEHRKDLSEYEVGDRILKDGKEYNLVDIRQTGLKKWSVLSTAGEDEVLDVDAHWFGGASFFLPSERSDSLKESEDSPEPPNSLADFSGSSQSKSIPTPNASSNPNIPTSQSGQTSKTITQKQEQPTYIQLDFLAQALAAPESEPDSIIQNQDSGLKLCGVSVKADRLSWLLNNLKALSTEDCEQSLGDSEWQATVGSIRSLYQHLLSEVPKDVKDSLLLPTVTSSAGGSTKTSRDAGGNKLITWFKSNGLLENGLVLNAQVVEQLLGFPMDWTAPSESQEDTPANTSEGENSLAEQSSPSKPPLPSDSSKSSGSKAAKPLLIDNRIWFDAENNTAQIGFRQKAQAEKWGQFLAQICTLAESYEVAFLEENWKYGLKLKGILPDTVKELAIANLDSSFPDRAYGGQAPRRVIPKSTPIFNGYRVTRNLEEIWKGDSIQEGINLFEAEKENPISKTLSFSGPNYESIEIWKRSPDEVKPVSETVPTLKLGDVVELGNYLGDWEVKTINGPVLTVCNVGTGHTKEVFLANVKSKKQVATSV